MATWYPVEEVELHVEWDDTHAGRVVHLSPYDQHHAECPLCHHAARQVYRDDQRTGWWVKCDCTPARFVKLKKRES